MKAETQNPKCVANPNFESVYKKRGKKVDLRGFLHNRLH